MPSDDFIGELLGNTGPRSDAPVKPSAGDFFSAILAKPGPNGGGEAFVPKDSKEAPSTSVLPSEGQNISLAQGASLGLALPAMAALEAGSWSGPKYDAAYKRLEKLRREEGSDLLEGGAAMVPTFAATALTGIGGAAGAARLAPHAPRIAQGLEFLLGSGGGNMLTRALSRGAAGAWQGAESGVLQSGLTNESLGESAKRGAIEGAIMNPLTAGPASMLRSEVSPSVAQMAQRFTNLGVPLRTGQLPGAPSVTKSFGKVSENQLGNFNRAISRTFGEDTPTLNHETLFGPNGAAPRIGAEMDRITQRYAIPHSDAQFTRDLQALWQQASSDLASNPAELSRVAQHIRNVWNSWSNGQHGLNGETYQAFTKYGSPLYRDLKSSNSNLSHYAGEIKSAVDEAWGRALPPNEAATWRELKGQYKNLMSVKPALDETTGHINPNKLLASVVRKNNGTSANAGDLGILAEGGKNFLAPNMDSKIPAWLRAHPGITGMAGIGAGALGMNELAPAVGHFAAGNPLAAGALGAAGASGIGAGALMSMPWYANYIARTGGRGIALDANPLIPPVNYLYGDRGAQNGQ